MITPLDLFPSHDAPFAELPLTALFLGEQDILLLFLARADEFLDASARVQHLSQSFPAITFVALSETRKDLIAIFVKVDFASDHTHPGSILEMSL
jgi:hypothetical protein